MTRHIPDLAVHNSATSHKQTALPGRDPISSLLRTAFVRYSATSCAAHGRHLSHFHEAFHLFHGPKSSLLYDAPGMELFAHGQSAACYIHTTPNTGSYFDSHRQSAKELQSSWVFFSGTPKTVTTQVEPGQEDWMHWMLGKHLADPRHRAQRWFPLVNSQNVGPNHNEVSLEVVCLTTIPHPPNKDANKITKITDASHKQMLASRGGA